MKSDRRRSNHLLLTSFMGAKVHRHPAEVNADFVISRGEAIAVRSPDAPRPHEPRRRWRANAPFPTVQAPPPRAGSPRCRSPSPTRDSAPSSRRSLRTSTRSPDSAATSVPPANRARRRGRQRDRPSARRGPARSTRGERELWTLGAARLRRFARTLESRAPCPVPRTRRPTRENFISGKGTERVLP